MEVTNSVSFFFLHIEKIMSERNLNPNHAHTVLFFPLSCKGMETSCAALTRSSVLLRREKKAITEEPDDVFIFPPSAKPACSHQHVKVPMTLLSAFGRIPHSPPLQLTNTPLIDGSVSAPWCLLDLMTWLPATSRCPFGFYAPLHTAKYGSNSMAGTLMTESRGVVSEGLYDGDAEFAGTTGFEDPKTLSRLKGQESREIGWIR